MRICVKNLPKFITKEQIEKEFGVYGQISDICMLKNTEGIFRRICYIGYTSNEISNTVIKKMNGSYIFNHKIIVEKSIAQSKFVSESEERIVKYNNKFIINNISKNIDSNLIKEELEKWGVLRSIEFIDKNKVVVDYIDNEVSLKVYKELNTLFGKTVKAVPYKEFCKQDNYYNSLFFNFESVIKRTCENENLRREHLVDVSDKDLGTKITLLETNLVNETSKFLIKNGINLEKIKKEKNKKVLIVRNIDVDKVLNFVAGKCKIEIAPSKNLCLLKFQSEEEAYVCFKKLNLRRFNDQVVYCEYAPLSDIVPVVEKHELCKNVKLIVKNVPFQATKEDILNLFKNKFNVQSIRMPKKRDNTLRGFAFLTFDSNESLMKAVEYFGKSTHLYGRRLVLEVAKE